MTFQQYIQQKNLDISIVDLEESIFYNRLDSEFFIPNYVNSDFLIKNKKWDFLSTFHTDIRYWLNTEPDYVNDWVNFVRALNLKEYWIEWDVLKIPLSEEKIWKINLLKKWDLLVVRSWANVGDNWVAVEEELLNWTFWSYIIRIRLDENKINPIFIWVFLKSNFWRYQTIRFRSWAAQPNISIPNLNNLLIPIPSKSFQTQIANLVQESYKQKEISKKLYLEAEKLLLSELWLEEYKPTEQNISIKDSEEVKLFWRVDAEFFQPKYDEIIEKIKSYKLWYDILENLITISNSKIKKEEDKTFKYIELADINASLWVVNVENDILSQDLPSRAQMKIQNWDVLVSSLAWSADKVAIIINEDKNLVASTWFFVLRSKFFNSETNLILMKSWIYKDMLIRSARWMIMEATNKEDFSKFILPKVDIKIQEKIAELVKESHISLDLSKQLLEKAKKSVEIFIEEDEMKAGEFLDK